MTPDDAVMVLGMARSLAAAVNDPQPELTADELLLAASERWFDCLVAELRGELVGYALLCRAYEAHTGKRRLWLADLYVQPSARRGGTGRALLVAAACHALALGCDTLYWELWRPNVAGAQFFRAVGAEEVVDLAIMRFDRRGLAALAS